MEKEINEPVEMSRLAVELCIKFVQEEFAERTYVGQMTKERIQDKMLDLWTMIGEIAVEETTH